MSTNACKHKKNLANLELYESNLVANSNTESVTDETDKLERTVGKYKKQPCFVGI
uniref:Uncharacterized protein n=1 Tax=Setaria italica TaxID=4555 RepID=K4AHX9_SETIT